MIAAGLRRPPEGWRRTVGILLRSESTRFALSAFGLRVPESGSPILPVAILSSSERRRRSRRSWRVSRMRTSRSSAAGHESPADRCVDFVVLRFGHDGRLEAIDPHLANSGSSAPASDVCARVHDAIVQGYNSTSKLREVDRPGRLLGAVRAALRSAGLRAHEAYAQRLLAASCLSFESSIRPIRPSASGHRHSRRGGRSVSVACRGWLDWRAVRHG